LFWEALELLQLWERQNLPGIDSRQGMALLLWLLKNDGRARRIGDLYKTVRISEPTMREVVKAFADHGLAVIEPDSKDPRYRLIRGTDKLKQKVEEYRMWLVQLGEGASRPQFCC
jgi:DNA-binding MarR family transcriptional regulator